MQFKTLLTGLAAFAAIGIVGAAQAQTVCTFDGSSSNDWNTAANWDTNNVPDSVSEIAVIPNNAASGYGVNLNANITCGGLEIYERSSLNIAPTASATLTIDRGIGTTTGLVILRATSDSVYAVINIGDSDAAHTGVLRLDDNDTSPHLIGGDIILWEADSMLDVETDSATFGPYNTYFGSVVGYDDDALVEIDSGLTLVNRIIFEGRMEINAESGTATFLNDRDSSSSNSGVVWANGDGTLRLGTYLVLGDSNFVLNGTTYRPLWKASDCAAVLEFNRETDGPFSCQLNTDGILAGDFLIERCGTMSFNECLETAGVVSFVRGTIVVAPGKHFNSYTEGTHVVGYCP